MEADLNQLMDEASKGMEKAVEHLRNEFTKIRAGKATPRMLDGIYVDYYGYNTPLNQLATINTPDARTISIQPWEKNMIEPIEKAIHKANLGLNPQNDGSIIRITIPNLTEERRKELVKYIKNEGESAKISIRNVRQETKDKLKKMQKEGLPEDEVKAQEEALQKMTDNSIEKVNEIIEHKEKEIMSI